MCVAFLPAGELHCSNSGIGFKFKYCIHRITRNDIHIQNGVGDLETYYSSDWATAGSLESSDSITLSGSASPLTLKATTNMLSGADDPNHTYSLDVHIGLSA
jgi:hypothetical protein